MNIYDENQKLVGELIKPEPVQDKDGTWYEAGAFRKIKIGECCLGFDGLQSDEVFRADGELDRPVWIMSPIPRPTPEQLADIEWMRERDDRPVKCKEWDAVWCEGLNGWKGIQVVMKSHVNTIGKYRWVLVPVEKRQSAKAQADVISVLMGMPVEKEVTHSYANCGRYHNPCEEGRNDMERTDCSGCPRWTPKPPVARDFEPALVTTSMPAFVGSAAHLHPESYTLTGSLP